MDESDTRRLLRHAITNRIFHEPRKGVVAHSAASKTLAETPLLRQWLGQAFDDMWPSAARVVDAMTAWPGSEEPTETGFNLANDTTVPFFEEIKKQPLRAQRFADAMTFFHAGPGLETTHVVNGYAWAALQEDAVVVDVGGSHGSVSREIVKNFPQIRCVVQDLPDVIEGVSEPHETDCLIFESYDFFTEQQVRGADVYFFRMIFHNWSDKYCVRILRNTIPALKPGARIVINDFCLSDPGVLSPFMERNARLVLFHGWGGQGPEQRFSLTFSAGRCFDLAMKEIFNAKERDLDDWTILFSMADSRFEIANVIQLPESQLAIIEVVWKGSKID